MIPLKKIFVKLFVNFPINNHLIYKKRLGDLMKAIKIVLFITLLFSFFSCSSKPKKKEGLENQEMAELESDADFIAEEEDSADSEVDTEMAEASEPMESEQMASQSNLTGDYSNYTVEKGDTYMLIAFRIYGDYEKWRSIANENPGISQAGLNQGAVLKYRMPETEFKWNPEGLPYLIKTGDTLGTISHDKYGTDKKWRALWENNRPMIKNPDLIFAGFTLYYNQDDKRVSGL